MQELVDLKANSNDMAESVIRNAVAQKCNGSTEVQAEHGPIDVVTADEVVEVKRARKYTHALGQVLGHSEAHPEKKRRIHLFGTVAELTPELIEKSAALCDKYGVSVTHEFTDC